MRSCQSCQIFFVKSSILGQFLYCNECVVTPYDRTMSSYPCSSRLPNFNVNPALNIVQSKLSKCWIKYKLSKCWIKCISKKNYNDWIRPTLVIFLSFFEKNYNYWIKCKLSKPRFNRTGLVYIVPIKNL